MADWLDEVLSKPTTTVPMAGKALGLSRNASYEAAKRGEIETIRSVGGSSLRPPGCGGCFGSMRRRQPDGDGSSRCAKPGAAGRRQPG
jgi:hypothetical protein